MPRKVLWALSMSTKGGVDKSFVAFCSLFFSAMRENRLRTGRLLAKCVAHHVEDTTRRLKSIAEKVLEADQKIVLAGRARYSAP
jgi:hypothetical protein